MTDAPLDTFPKLVARNAAQWPDAVALREKDFGIWREISWAGFHARVRDLALALRALGIGPGAVVGLIGDNRPDWVAGEIATHAAGAMSLGLYRDALDEEVAYLIDHAGIALVLAEDEEQVDKLLALGDRIPSLRHIVYTDPRGMRKYDDPRLLPVEAFIAGGAALEAAEPGLYDRMVAATRGDDVAVLCTTSGTTAHPKLAMLSAGSLIRHSASYLAVDPKGPKDEYVSVLPLSWIMEQVYVFGKALQCRMVVNFVEEQSTTWADFREIGPSFVLLAPRVWEGLAADVRSRMMDASVLKRRLFDLGMKIGLKALDRKRKSPLSKLLLFAALRDRLGFSRLRSAATGGAALGPDTFRFFLAMGVPLRQLYGQTELLGAYTIHAADDVDFDTVGVAFDETVELRIDAPDPNGVGEIVTRHPNMFLGYYRNEAASTADLRDGWLATGDAGYVDARGHLVVIDRLKDLAVTSGGDRFSPQHIENKLKFSPFVGEAVILGHGRLDLAAIICIRFPIVSKWAEKKRISFTTYTDLSGRDEVYALLRREVETVNAGLPEAQRIRRFLLLYKELDADDGELTRTRKVRRGVIGEKYGDIIDAVYRGDPAIPVDTTIAFQDGTKQRIRTTLKVVDLAPGRPGQRHAAE
ncbi:long-chain acyl-CoA synthetase [Inquilinus ginsengisoli]|uniref:Long-chain acyl-CoA synthetase n=1 Tax=Inquilinus ginsengisoli TaxID=363840 RepID=A0ABU1JZ43_9PROT|nr:long-chain fatty acid--CoA ligase [Inquilinus ginsengisoli]MDR6292789.1 long-chain acyl-CoA synthetase [Inquilinus ginsengisoli]